MRSLLSLLAFLALVLGGGILIGTTNAPGEWYAALQKPPFNPPDWVFGPAWSILYVLIAIAGWRIWRRGPRTLTMSLWWLQLVLNFAWTPVFFTLHQIALALFVILALLVAILGFIASAWRKDRLAAALFLPYAAWVAFAAVLNGSILWLN